MEAPSVLTVVLTGILLVFFTLLLLTALIAIFGSIMKALHKEPETTPVAPAPVAAPTSTKVVEKVVSDDTEVVAVIAAAVAAMGGGTVVSIKKQQAKTTSNGNAVNAWKQSSILSYLQQV